MVQGMKTINRKSQTLQLDYLITVVEIKPWPPTQSLRSLRSALIQWEYGEKNSGSTKAVVPLLVTNSGIGDGKIEYNESFTVRVILVRDGDTLLKNCIEFNMYEPRRDKTVKGQLLATAILDFAEYGVVKDGLITSIPINCKRTLGNTIQPMLIIKIEPVKKSRNRMRSSSMDDRYGLEFSVNEETKSGSITDDDDDETSLTLRSNGSSNPRKEVLVYDNTVGGSSGENIGDDEGNVRNVKPVDISKVQELEHKVQSLEGELREAAGIEVGLYSIIAEHGSSINKVHAPARRLSRLYIHACKHNLQSRRAYSAKSIVSGLILVAKACGNDVTRLTFWLSNCVILRAIIYNTFEQDHVLINVKWKEFCSKQTRGYINEWEKPCNFTSALEKVESWIFSRIIESLWWQTLTPYMQSAAAKAIIRVVNSEEAGKNMCGDRQSLEQANFSMELWKTAFMDACERICPVRAAGHDCGCLPLISRLVMEQCMGRLDVAMFNAILRESADEVPTDPVSDPMSDARVLPISSGKSSFGAGAQLKNVIGNWSRWLTDLFGIDDDYAFENENEDNNNTSFKSFHLLNALSDLMMLPKDMLLSNTVRKEVCPTFGAPLIKRILDSFVPDEFCPDPIPMGVLEALDLEDSFVDGEDCVTSLPFAAALVVYHAPSASSLRSILGDGTQLTCSGSILRKSNTSDDELDEMTSPLTAITDTCQGSPRTNASWKHKETGSIRYQLLKEVWLE